MDVRLLDTLRGPGAAASIGVAPKRKLPRLPDLGAAIGFPPMQEQQRTPAEIEQDDRAFAVLCPDGGTVF